MNILGMRSPRPEYSNAKPRFATSLLVVSKSPRFLPSYDCIFVLITSNGLFVITEINPAAPPDKNAFDVMLCNLSYNKKRDIKLDPCLTTVGIPPRQNEVIPSCFAMLLMHSTLQFEVPNVCE